MANRSVVILALIFSMSAWAEGVPKEDVAHVEDQVAAADSSRTTSVKDYIITNAKLEHMCFAEAGEYRCMESGIAVTSEKTVVAGFGKVEVSIDMDRCIAAQMKFDFTATEDTDIMWKSAKIDVGERSQNAWLAKEANVKTQRIKKGERFSGNVVESFQSATCWPLKTETLRFSVDLKVGDEIRELRAEWKLQASELTKEETVTYMPKPVSLRVEPSASVASVKPELPKKRWKQTGIAASTVGLLSAGFCTGLLAVATAEEDGPVSEKAMVIGTVAGVFGLVTGSAAGIVGRVTTEIHPDDLAQYRAEVQEQDYRRRFDANRAEVKLWEDTVLPIQKSALAVTSRATKPKVVVAQRRLNFGYEAPPAMFDKSREKRIGNPADKGCSDEKQNY